MDRLTVRDEFGNADIIALMDVMLDLYNVLSGEEMNVFTHTLNKLAYYEDLAEQGRLVELPCAKGDTVYFIHRGEIKKDIIGYISLDIYGNVLEIWLGANDNVLFRLNQAVFLTREEAEAKLKEMESNDRDS